MSALLLEKDLRNAQPSSEVFVLAQARTTTTLRELDNNRRRLLFDFLSAAELNAPENRQGLLQNANLAGIDFSDPDPNDSRFNKADFSGMNLVGADMSRANLRGADCLHANLTNVDLSGADLQYARFSDPLEDALEAEARGQQSTPRPVTSLSSADLIGADLSYAGLNEVNLSNADLSGANLSGTFLYGADLTNADLYAVNLIGANLNGTEKLFLN